MKLPLPHPCASGVMFASGYTGVQAMAEFSWELAVINRMEIRRCR
jgi:hypothetical protein